MLHVYYMHKPITQNTSIQRQRQKGTLNGTVAKSRCVKSSLKANNMELKKHLIYLSLSVLLLSLWLLLSLHLRNNSLGT